MDVGHSKKIFFLSSQQGQTDLAQDKNIYNILQPLPGPLGARELDKLSPTELALILSTLLVPVEIASRGG